MTRRKDGLYQEVLTINGKRKFFYGKTKAEVLRKVRAYEEKQEQGELFADVAKKWWAEHEPKLAYNSTKNYKPAYQRAVDQFGNMFIKEIVPVQIATFIQKFSRTYAQKTVKTQLMVINLIFQYAVENGYALINAPRDVSIPSNLRKTKRTSPPPEEIAIVKESADCTFGMFAIWLLYTGMRRGELLALEWSDVSLRNRTIKVNKSVYHDNNQPKIKKPKTETSVAVLPLLDALAEKLKPGKGLVFPGPDGKLMTQSQFDTNWKAYCKETGIKSTPHQFRHAFATMLFEAGIPPEEAQALLRHAQLATTMDVYTDLREAKLKAIHQKVYNLDIT